MRLKDYTLLKESLASARKKYLNTRLIAQDTFKELVDGDPSKTKKYLEWMCKMYDNVYSLTSSNIIDTVKLFDKAIKTKFELPSKDINYYKNSKDFVSLVEVLKDFENYQLQTRASVKQQGVEKIFENDKCIMLYIKTKEACMLYGSHTRWCITEKKEPYWEEYNSTNLFIFLLDKTNPSIKYAVAINSYNLFEYTDSNKIKFSIWNQQDNNMTFSFISILNYYGIAKIDDFFNIIRKAIPQKNFFEERMNKNLTNLIEKGSFSKNNDGTYNINIANFSTNIYRSFIKNNKFVIKFNHCKTSFNIEGFELLSLNGCPETVEGNFNCSDTMISSLKGAPKIVKGDYSCQNNLYLTTLKGCPEKINGSFRAYTCNFKSLKGSPKIVGTRSDYSSCFAVSSNLNLTSLEEGPEIVYGSYYCRRCNLKNLKGITKKISADLFISENPLVSLEGLEDCKLEGVVFLGTTLYNKFKANGILKKYQDLGYVFHDRG